jgi:hypothetical protein
MSVHIYRFLLGGDAFVRCRLSCVHRNLVKKLLHRVRMLIEF